jgi:hypothetical protein
MLLARRGQLHVVRTALSLAGTVLLLWLMLILRKIMTLRKGA